MTVRLFASAREAIGRGTVDWPVPAGGVPAKELVRALREAYPRLGPALRVSRFLRNDRYLTDLSERVGPGDEFSIHPPYGGG